MDAGYSNLRPFFLFLQKIVKFICGYNIVYM